MKVLGVGLHKTGTTTLGTCLKHFGLKHQAWTREGFGMWIDNRFDKLLEIAEQHDSFEDFPWALMYLQFDKEFPGTKFILTRRIDGETWFRSVCKHSKWTGPHEVNLHVYGNELPFGLQAEYITVYENHLKEVRAYFKDRPQDLLEVCWENGDGWSEICNFLGFDIPEIPFPHSNPSPGPIGRMLYHSKRHFNQTRGRAYRLWQRIRNRQTNNANKS
jgi:hypothetical protein